MEIDKIAFENLRTLGITKSFDDLDVNNDGKITKDDLSQSKDNQISVQINMLLSFADEDAELVAITKASADKETDADDNIKGDEETETPNTTEPISGVTEDSAENAGEYAKLQAQMNAINEEITTLNKQIETIESQNEVLKKEKDELETQQKAKAEELERANSELAMEEDKLNQYMQEYADNQAEMENLNAEILREQGREQEEYDHDIKKFTNQAIDAYNPETDGDDFNAYFAKKMDSFGFPAFSKLNSLNDEASSLSSSAQTLIRNISSQSQTVYAAKSKATGISMTLTALNAAIEAKTNEINVNNTKITSLQTDINTKNALKAEIQTEIGKLVEGGGMSAAEVLAKVSECEKNLAKEKGVKLEDCLIMQGADGNWHIYIMNEKDGYYKSVARYYLDYSQESFDMIPCGSGEIYTSQFSYTEGSGKAAYRITNANDCWTDGDACMQPCCYQTCSPLSFDVDGNGIQTAEKTVQFDIDGDGVVDTVNNSAEWVLAFDKDHNGVAGENGSELFGNNTDLDGDGVKDGYRDGFEALKALAMKEGLISSTDSMLDENDIKKLQEKYGLVMTNGYGGDAKNLTDLGITQINLAQTTDTTLERNFDGRNNDIMRQEGATFVVNGEEREYADIWNAKKSADEDTSIIDSRLNPEKETYMVASTRVNSKAILKLNKEGVVALEGNIDFKSLKNSAINKVEAPKIDILNEVVEEKDDDDYNKRKI